MVVGGARRHGREVECEGQWEVEMREHCGTQHGDRQKRKMPNNYPTHLYYNSNNYLQLHYRPSVSFLQAAASLSQEDGSRMPPRCW